MNGVECLGLQDCPDTDGDNTADYLDSDDDGDSLPTLTECVSGVPCLDSDSDAAPNYLDPDDDGDHIRTLDEIQDSNELGVLDVDLDGMVNWLDTDADGDDSPDSVEGRSSSPQGIPGYLDPDYLGGGALAGGAWQCGVSTRPGRSWWPLFLVLFAVRRRKTSVD